MKIVLELALFSILCAVIITAIVLIAAAMRMPVTFKNLDEERAVYDAAYWAERELNLGRKDRRLLYSRAIWVHLYGYSWMGSIPVAELAILAPFINRIIDGKGPPLNLPAEYEDIRPKILGQFKKRMEAEGLWPRA
jgi:hypothetical protein